MTKDKIIELAREAGFVESNRFSDIVVKHSNGSWVPVYDLVENLINISQKYEREQCAKVCENLYYGLRIQPTRSECAYAIRSRK